MLTAFVAVWCCSCCNTHQKLEAADRNMSIAMSAEAFRSAHGRLPTSEADLVGGAAAMGNRFRTAGIDPMRFERRHDGSVVIHWRERSRGPLECRRSGRVHLLPD